MANSIRPGSPLGWTSLALGIIGLILLIVVAVLGNLPTTSSYPNDLMLGFIVTVFVAGVLGLLAGMGAVIGIVSGAHRGWLQAIPGILLGMLNLIIGMAGLTLNVGTF